MKLYAGLRKYMPPGIPSGEIKRSLQEGISVSNLIKEMNIPGEEVMLVLVNSEDIMGQKNEREDRLQDGDLVELFPPMMGG